MREEAAIIDREAVVAVAAEARAMLHRMDSVERIVEPVASFAAATTKAALSVLSHAAEVVLALEPQMVRFEPRPDILPGTVASLIAAADVALGELKALYDKVKVIEASPFTYDPEVLRLARVVSEALYRLFDFVEVQRQAGLETQADLDITAGRVRKFGNADAAIAHLKRLADKTRP